MFAKREAPQHRVRITKPFYLGVNEVTVGQFSRFTNSGYVPEQMAKGIGGIGLVKGEIAQRDKEYTWLAPGYTPSMEQPVTNVTWKDAEAYCAWLSKKDKLAYRLPTEAEWEYACRAGTTTFWSFADEFVESLAGEFMVYQSGLPGGKGRAPFQPPSAVGKHKSNAFGLHDMHGNVAEMCSDFYSETYYERCRKAGTVADPQAGAKDKVDSKRVLRGGSILETAPDTRSASRTYALPDLGYCNVGFRIVREIPLPKE
jgi:formylglycine-generating enzyme required for sulfatase activity